ncbi:2-octaprenyl-6-methoxyphenyl hydroxylase [Kineobactrum salinum]|uniref:2-octaprenyl-6-methoxyphenyl hydroxylase n=1 Tax=Kineobactrum salinum TaxID=2708301 RepID=A0A6C0U0C3_9GAMM|nr:2-octaprenyl-6-methoxyphenyl hydroxylase [Kineobactrum salinum]QIB65481.1 2-octaprenyl-6-methoxyphenyl hydroxylase [Kineobactrum salinum]
MATKERDIVIAGGGMVGISLALQLAHSLPDNRRITLVESLPLPSAEVPQPDYHPAFDARSTALSYSSELIYRTIGVWPVLQRWLCPIDSIHVSNRGRFGSALLRAGDHGWSALGHVVENPWLGRALLQVLRQQDRVELLNPARVVAVTPQAGSVELQLEGDAAARLRTSLLVVADGAASDLRAGLGIGAVEKPYHQHALACNVAFAEPHCGCAFERFTSQGPLALLPLLPVADAEHRSALVWTLPPQQAAALSEATETEFLGILQRRFGYRLGRLRQAGARYCYPLSLHQCQEQVRAGVVVMGNAAHALHPVAGQGFNLALRDIAALGSVLAAAAAAGEGLGELAVLQRYRRRQHRDQQRTISFSDQLPALFMHADPLLGLARDLALSGLDWATPLKRRFVRQAAGLAALGGWGG